MIRRLLAALLIVPTLATASEPARPVIRVGIDDGDVRGRDQRALQAAVDYISNLGGGTVEIGAGRYTLRHPLNLRSNVHLVGVPGKTVVVLAAGRKSALSKD